MIRIFDFFLIFSISSRISIKFKVYLFMYYMFYEKNSYLRKSEPLLTIVARAQSTRVVKKNF
jgi:hypothetical protein